MSKKKKIAVILFNLGGPDKKESVKPFLFNLFYDKAIISLPNPFRYLVARIISIRRERVAQDIYSHIGDKSPIVEETLAQASSLEVMLNDKKDNVEYKIFISMRYWHPFSEKSVEDVKKYAPDEIILLPLYPQFSTTTTESSFENWHKSCKKQGLDVPTKSICCYPFDELFIDSHAELLKEYLDKSQDKKNIRILFSAHGLPQKIIDKGDSYQYQVERTSHAIVKKLGIKKLDFVVCYQSKVGPLDWIKPSTDEEILRAGSDGKGVLIVPVAFVSEHSETLVELDIEYREMAKKNSVKEYIRVPTLSANEKYIQSLVEICKKAGDLSNGDVCSDQGIRICPKKFTKCISNK